MELRNVRLIFDPLFRFAEANAKVAPPGNVDQRNILALPLQNLLKKSMLLLVALFIFTSVALMAQSPQKINFQSIVRNTNGVIFSNKTLSLKISILSDSITGTQVYSETHSSTTDAIGLVSLQIGSGTALSGAFATINWGDAAHFIKLEADFNGGNNYVLLGTQELMSVPYAMYASKTDTASLNLTNRFAAKAPINNPQFTGTVGGITKAMVGLGNVDNTSDEDKPVSSAAQTALAAIYSAAQDTLAAIYSATQTALAAKAPKNNPEFTGQVSGIDKTMVGLSSVDNTSDEDKPVSIFTQAAIDTKVNISDTMTMLVKYLRKEDFPSGSQDGEILYWSQGSWIKLAPGNSGQSIIIGNFGLPTWDCLIPNTADTTMSNLGQTFVVNTPITPITIRTTGVTRIGNYSILPVGLVASWSANVITITGTPTLVGFSQQFSVDLRGSCGAPIYVSGLIDVINATVPDAPTGVVATAGDGSASVAFVAPTNNGGSDITNYRVTSTPGGFEVLGGTSPITVNYLTNGTPYKFTVVAENLVGKSVASAASAAVTPAAVCPTDSITYNSYTYNTVGIGTQCWMKENLRTSMYNDGSAIPDETANTIGWGTLITGARTEYVAAGVTGYVSTYGYLYNWYAATDSRKICPTDWHVPTDSDWTKLTNELGGESLAGTVMKKSDVLWTTNTGTNTSGFSALPGGSRSNVGSFDYIRSTAFFWSATENDSTRAWYRILSYNDGSVTRYNYYKSFGYSVRCLRD
jgi:uncharacterized protein (TIGR02145 family)